MGSGVHQLQSRVEEQLGYLERSYDYQDLHFD